MGGAIFATALLSGLALHVLGSGWSKGDGEAIEAFTERRFSAVWNSPGERRALAQDLARTFHLSLTLEDPQGRVMDETGGGCTTPWRTLLVGKRPELLGRVLVCGGSPAARTPLGFFGALFGAALMLWLASGFIARRLGRPLWQLARVTSQIGKGDLSARVRLGRHRLGEVGMLAHSINDMAERLEKQVNAQRELLAVVSHEIRTPLSRLRLITEMWRDAGGTERLVGDAEREIFEIDDLTGQLLASSRLDFFQPELTRLDLAEISLEALRREGLPPELLDAPETGPFVEADPNLLARALSNLLKNAHAHGERVTKLALVVADVPAPIATAGKTTTGVAGEAAYVHLEVMDDGPGFRAGDLERVFETFVQGRASGQATARGRSGGGLGLGLALVKRIALAHGGRAWARNHERSGAVVGFSLKLSP